MLINKNHQHLKSKGMSLIELILAFALVSMSMLPMMYLLYSMLPKSIASSLGLLPSYEEQSEKWYDKNILFNFHKDSRNFEARSLFEDILTGNRSSISIEDTWNKNTCNLAAQDMAHFYEYIDSSYIEPLNTLDLEIGSTNVPTSLAILGDKLIISLNSSSTTDPDILVLDKSMAKLASLNTGPGLADMQVVGLNAFVANTSVNSQAQVIDLSTISSGGILGAININLKKEYVFPGANSSTTPTAKKVFVYKNILIVGTEKSLLPEIAVFDILSGKILANINTEYGINNLYAKDSKLYVLSPNDPEIEIFDLSPALDIDVNSLNTTQDVYGIVLQKIGEYDAPSASGNARSLDFVGDNIFFTRSKGGEELSIISKDQDVLMGDQNNLNNNLALYFSKIFGYKVISSVDAVIGDLNRVVIFTSDLSRSIMFFEVDKKDLRGNPISLRPIKDLSLPARISGLACRDNIIFLATKSAVYPFFTIKVQ